MQNEVLVPKHQTQNFWNPLGQNQWEFTCSKLTIETLEQGLKYVQS